MLDAASFYKYNLRKLSKLKIGKISVMGGGGGVNQNLTHADRGEGGVAKNLTFADRGEGGGSKIA